MSTSPIPLISYFLTASSKRVKIIKIHGSKELKASHLNISLPSIFIHIMVIQTDNVFVCNSSYLFHSKQMIRQATLSKIKWNKCQAYMYFTAILLVVVLLPIIGSTVICIFVIFIGCQIMYNFLFSNNNDTVAINKRCNYGKAKDAIITDKTHHSPELTRLKIALSNYYDNNELINITPVLDDFLHLLSVDNKRNQFDPFPYHYSCSIDKCKIFRRNYRNRTHDRVQQKADVTDIAKLQIMDKIHCYFHHSSDICNTQVIETIVENNHKYDRYMQLTPTKIYSIGYQFEYDMEHNIQSTIPNSYYVRYIEPKYLSLKQELLYNEICAMSVEQFVVEYQKAQIHHISYHKKKHYDEILIQNILAIMIYCNYDVLQRRFSETYRLNDNIKCKNELIECHSTFYHMGKTLKYAVQHFGETTDNSLYHGIGEELIFPMITTQKSSLNVYCPLSTTSSFCVAVGFTQRNCGLILEFQQSADKNMCAKCFQTCWLSDFGNEMEHLFIQNTNGMYVSNIINMKHNIEFKIIIKCLNTLDNVLSEFNFYEDSNMSEAEIKICDMIIQHQLYRNGLPYNAFPCLHLYAETLINQYFINKKHISCDWSLFNSKYRSIAMWLCCSEFQFLNLQILCTLFPNIVSISLKWRINLKSTTLEYVLNYFIVYKKGNLKMISIAVSQNTQIKQLILQYKNKFLQLHYFMYMTNRRELCINKFNWHSTYITQNHIKHCYQLNTYLNCQTLLRKLTIQCHLKILLQH
eukprot:141160_1